MTDPVMLLSQVHGEGRVTFRALRAAGFYTIAAVAETPVQSLSDRAHLSARTARRLKTGAEEMIGKGIGSEPAPAPGPGGAAARPSRRGSGGTGAPPRGRFSEGVSLDEALLLGQGTTAPPIASMLAAAAEAAAALPRAAVAGHRTFWTFG